MDNITINIDTGNINGIVRLPASKSISNRVLIVNALSGTISLTDNLSDCDDTEVMFRILHSEDNRFDVGHAGTAMRFLTAYLSRIIGCWEITGSERMKQRPIGILVDALNGLGAKIEYLEKSGYPPLRIYGSRLTGGKIEIAASVSSQYISALMMIAPCMEKGLEIVLAGPVVSRTYIDMTAGIMKEFGVNADISDNVIRIAYQSYVSKPYQIEADWSGASYFYELLAVADSGEIRLPGLTKNSLQGDSGQVEVWRNLGVATRFEKDGVLLSKIKPVVTLLEYNFIEMPDLVQSFAVACCMKGIPFVFKGLETLRIKETDRIGALVAELAKLGYILTTEDDCRLSWDGTYCDPVHLEINTYHDHRMAMAFAPAALKHPGLIIVDKDVVSKSFPDYWIQLQNLVHSMRIS